MEHKIIAIGRQFGSGGHEIAFRLSEELGIPMYDRDLVEMAADKLGLSEITVEAVDESVFNSFLSSYRYNGFAPRRVPLNDSTFETQSKIIESLAQKGPCIFVGRCADYVLREYPQCMNIFVYASQKDRTERIMKRYNISKKEAEASIKKMDHRRKQYYETYTDQSWGSIESHQILFNISKLGIPQTIDTIKHLYADSSSSDPTKTNT
ncbi:AAA family ATPase [Lacrimispora defluvii]|uniref:Cytidylate kinase-like family protein n=1 Tax=Lacrimispora defluvii TaxID=2719233 RepID=A0ABX1VMZ9_9FIRM|nr:cytidylate kinase-like family protein [Lacrimispora defluvii]NNJ29280.1 cytidylate kinase-like family protein [Lacrimispora defluvii]